MDAKLTASGNLVNSGLPKLEQALVRFLHTQKARALLTHVTDRIEDIVKGQQAAFDAAEWTIADPERAALMVEQLRARVAGLSAAQNEILAPLGEHLGSELVSRFDRELTVWREEVHAELMEQVQNYLKSADCLTLLAGAPELTATLSTKCGQRAQTWITDQGESFRRVILELAAGCAAVLDRSAQEAFHADDSSRSILMDGSIRPEASGDTLNRISLIYPPPPSFSWSFKARWCIYALPFRFVRHKVLRECYDSLASDLLDYLQEIRGALHAIANEWVNGLRTKLDESLSAAITRAETMLNAKTEPAERATLDDLLSKLQILQNRCAALNGQADSESDLTIDCATVNDRPQEPPKSDSLAVCAICSRIENELFQFLAKHQYDLSTDEIERLDHAARGGFCALHTWHYESLASAQGICTAYPPVMLSLSRRLRLLAEQASPYSSAADDVKDLLPATGNCTACQFVATVEQETVKEFVTALSSRDNDNHENLPALCLPHLFSVLRAKPDEGTVRLLMLEQARVMEIIGEDMQRYALKHDAVRRYLATEGEWQAHKRGLSRLVGSRNLAKP